MEKTNTDWEPVQDYGYAASKKPWVVQRRDEKAWGGYRTLCGKGGTVIRFTSEQSAMKRANELNRSTANA